MNGGSNPVKAKRIKQADHTVVIPADITQTDDIVWMNHGQHVTFEHGASFSLEFVVESPDEQGGLVFKSDPPQGGKHRRKLKLKTVGKMTACKYTIVVGGTRHDPIIIIDPNAPSNEN